MKNHIGFYRSGKKILNPIYCVLWSSIILTIYVTITNVYIEKTFKQILMRRNLFKIFGTLMDKEGRLRISRVGPGGNRSNVSIGPVESAT